MPLIPNSASALCTLSLLDEKRHHEEVCGELGRRVRGVEEERERVTADRARLAGQLQEMIEQLRLETETREALETKARQEVCYSIYEPLTYLVSVLELGAPPYIAGCLCTFVTEFPLPLPHHPSLRPLFPLVTAGCCLPETRTERERDAGQRASSQQVYGGTEGLTGLTVQDGDQVQYMITPPSLQGPCGYTCVCSGGGRSQRI